MSATELALEEFPEDVLLRILAGVGSKAILRISTCCKRLHALARMLQFHRCFSAAASMKSDLGDALEEACERALEGMLGYVDFALVFVANYYNTAKLSLASKVVEGLLQRLPLGTQLVGCTSMGLMGVGPSGAFEVDPSNGGRGRGPTGVALLLGRMPGCRVKAFCNLSPMLPKQSSRVCVRRCTLRQVFSGSLKREVAINAFIEWLSGSRAGASGEELAAGAGDRARGGEGKDHILRRRPGIGDGDGDTRGAAKMAAAQPVTSAGTGADSVGPSTSARDLGIQNVWIMMAGSDAAFDLLVGPGGLLHWLQVDEKARPVIAGGVSSGRRKDLFFHPGCKRYGPAAAAAPAGPITAEYTATPALAEEETVAEEAEGSEVAAEPSSGPSSSRCSNRGRVAIDISNWDPATKGLQFVGLAVMAVESPEPGGGSALTTSGGMVNAEEAGCTEAVATTAAKTHLAGAAATADAGASEMPVGVVLPAARQGTASDPQQVAVRACALAMRGCAGLPGQPVFEDVSIGRVSPISLRSEEEDESDKEDGGGVLVTVSGGKSTGSMSLAEQLRAVWNQRGLLPQLAVWLASRGDESIHSGLNVQVFRSECMVMGLVEPSVLAFNGDVALNTDDTRALDAIMEGASRPGAVLCCQVADITAQGCRLHLQAELPVLRSVCSPYPLLPGGCLDPRSWEGYAVMRRAALGAGARAGPVAMVVFSCTGRGREIFGEVTADCEARIADEVLQQGVPFVGAYCEGELGPYVRHGYAGWFFNPLCVQPPDASKAAGAAAVAESTGAIGGTSLQAATGPEASDPAHGACHGAPRYTVVAGGRVLPLDRTRMQGYTSVYAALG